MSGADGGESFLGTPHAPEHGAEVGERAGVIGADGKSAAKIR